MTETGDDLRATSEAIVADAERLREIEERKQELPEGHPDLAGLLMGAAACFGLGIPLLLLVEMQWMFFLWPLRIMSLGALVLGVFLAHSALVVKRRKVKRAGQTEFRRLLLLQELVFWIVAVVFFGALVALLYLP